MIWPWSSPSTDAILERAAEPAWKVEPPCDWPDPPTEGQVIDRTRRRLVELRRDGRLSANEHRVILKALRMLEDAPNPAPKASTP